MAKQCSLCGGKCGHIIRFKYADGEICTPCESKFSDAYRAIGYQNVHMKNTGEITIEQVKNCSQDPLGNKAFLIAHSQYTLEEEKRQIEEQQIKDKNAILNKKCLICNKEITGILDGYCTRDGRRICLHCSFAANTLEVGERLNRPSEKQIITSRPAAFFVSELTDFVRISEFMVINYKKETIYDVSKGTFRFNQIIKIENGQETFEVEVGKKGHPIIRAVVGNALFGTTGAVVGAVTNHDTRHFKEQKGRRILVIYFRTDSGEIIKDEEKCQTDEEFIKLETAIMKIFESEESKDSSNQMEQVIASAVQSAVSDMQPALAVQADNNISVADEIKKFKELLDMGALTQEEFDAKKKQLLGL
jgi:hypothetical protein